MCRRHDGNQRSITDGEIAHSMGNSEGDQIKLSGDGLRHLLQDITGRRVPLIGQPLDALAVVVIADVTREGHHGTGTVIAHCSLHRLTIEWPIDHFDQTDCAHEAIISALG